MERCPVCGKQLICDYKHFVNPKTGEWKEYRGKSIRKCFRWMYKMRKRAGTLPEGIKLPRRF